MKGILIQFVARFILVASILIGATESFQCVDKLYDIFLAESAVTDDRETRTYVLCPDSVYDVSESFDSEVDSAGSPLVFGRSNMHVLCGEDGKIENSCTIRGGHVQAHLSDRFFTKSVINNVLIQGITFSNSVTHSVLAEHPGRMLILDCRFEENKGQSVILFQLWTKAGAEQIPRVSSENITQSEKSRTFGIIAVRDSVFINNQIWSYSGNSTEGLVSAKDGTSLEISDSLFIGNTVDEELQLAYLVGVENGDLLMRNNCFFSNDDRIAPVVLSKSSYDVESSFVQHKTHLLSATRCEFLSIDMGGLLFSGGGYGAFTCEMSDLQVCSIPALLKPGNGIPCERSLQALAEGEFNADEGNATRTFILCKNTNFDVDVSGTLELSQSNVRILCGPEGRQSNNCVLEKGSTQISIMNEKAPVDKVSILGLTFSQASFLNVAAQTPSDVLLSDCMFRNNSNMASVFAGAMRTSTFLTDLAPESQTEATGTISVTLLGSSFLDNTVGTVFEKQTGLVTSEGASLKIVNSLFFGTKYQIGIHGSSHIIGSFEGFLELKNNCFDGNEASLAPVVIHSSSHRLSSNGGRNNVIFNELCDFAMEYTGASTIGREPSDEIPFSCFSFDVNTCFGEDEEMNADNSLDHTSNDSVAPYRSDVLLLVAATNCLVSLII